MPTNEYADLRTGLVPKNAYLPNSMDLKPRKGQKHNFWCFSAGFFDMPCILSGNSPEKSPLATPYGALKCHRQLYMRISTALTPLQPPSLAASTENLNGPEYTCPEDGHPARRSGSPRSQPLPGHGRNSRSSFPVRPPLPSFIDPILIPPLPRPGPCRREAFKIAESTLTSAPAHTVPPPAYAVPPPVHAVPPRYMPYRRAVLSSPALPCQCNDRANLLKLPHLD